MLNMEDSETPREIDVSNAHVCMHAVLTRVSPFDPNLGNSIDVFRGIGEHFFISAQKKQTRYVFVVT